MADVFMPRTLDELLDLKEKKQSLALFAGGTDLMVALRHHRIQPKALACLDHMDAMREITDTGNHIAMGAGTTHAGLLASPLVQEHIPVLARALETLGSPHIRNMGTLGGNIVTASPAGDCLPPLTVLNARVELASRDGFQTLPISDFITGPGTTCLKPGQILWRVLVPKTPAYCIHHFEKVGLRRSLSIAVVSMAAVLNLAPDGCIQAVRMAWGSVGKTVVTCPEAEDILSGNPLDPAVLEKAAQAVMQWVNPISDVRATAGYRRKVAGNLVLRLTRYAAPPEGGVRP
ncbi:MAG: xanthine dehydrogenase family protein subunit M [Pseudomonadota bacterium]